MVWQLLNIVALNRALNCARAHHSSSSLSKLTNIKTIRSLRWHGSYQESSENGWLPKKAEPIGYQRKIYWKLEIGYLEKPVDHCNTHFAE